MVYVLGDGHGDARLQAQNTNVRELICQPTQNARW